MQSRRTWYRKFSLITTIVFLLTATACGSGGNKNNASPAASGKASSEAAVSSEKASEQPAEKVTLKFLYTWPEFKTSMDKIIKMFEETHPNIKVDVSVTPWDKIKDQLQVAYASGEAPDVNFMWPKDMATYIGQDVAMDLTPYLEEDQEWKTSFIDDDVLIGGTYGGKIYNTPFRGSTTFIGYNNDLFKANGWTEPKSISEMETLMDAMMEKGVTPFAIAGNPNGFHIEKINQYFVGYNLMTSGVLTDPEYVSARKVDVKGPYAEAAEMSRKWYNKGYYGKSPLGIAREQSQALFYTGKSAMILLNNNELTALREGVDNQFEIKYMVFPAAEGADDLFLPGGFDGFMVYKETKHPKESIELLKFLNSEEAQNLWAKETLSVMTRKGVNYTDPDISTFASYISVAGKYMQFPDYNTGDVVTRNAQEFSDFLLKPSYTPEELENVWNENYKKQIELES